MTEHRKLVEVALPLDAINRESAREKSIRSGHPSTFHLWWARRPLAACRAVLFAQLVDDPSSRPDLFPNEEEQDRERQRLFELIERLVTWEATNDEQVLAEARAEIIRSCGDDLPAVLDPFAGGGSIPIEAQRLGLHTHARDLNPVAALINRALIELPPRFAGRPPVHPAGAGQGGLAGHDWPGARGLAEDVRWYGTWMRDQAHERLGHLYPQATLSDGEPATVLAWLWARTAICPNPACRATMPLLNGFTICSRKGKQTWLRPHPAGDRVEFSIAQGPGAPSKGTVGRSGTTCLVCDTAVPLKYVRAEGKAGRMGMQLLAIVAEGNRRRIYLPADPNHVSAADVDPPDDVPDTPLPDRALGFRVQGYGLDTHADLFSARQLHVLTTFCDLVSEARTLCADHGGDEAYADAVATTLTLSIGRLANRCSTQAFWNPGRETVEQVMARTALPMIWVSAEANPFSDSSGNYLGQLDYLVKALERVPARGTGTARQADAAAGLDPSPVLVATDPPYYDNVPYADLSDFFYVWLRRAGGSLHPDLFGTVLVPKTTELIAEPARHDGWAQAAAFFEQGLRRVFEHIRNAEVPGYPFTVFYAFKQAEEAADDGLVSTGWETMLQGLLDAGCAITGTWPIRTERAGGLRLVGRNSLASSIVLVCRPRAATAGITDRAGFLRAMHDELPQALRDMQKGNVAPVDLAQAAIGPGMAVFSRYQRVIEPSGEPMRVGAALGLINQVLDQVLAEQEGEFDPDTRWAIKWFDQHGFDEGAYGTAETLCTATATSFDGLQDAGIVDGRAGKVWLLARENLPDDWDPVTDTRVPVWEVTMHLIKRLEEHGEAAAADLLAQVGHLGDVARDLAYRLYRISERKSWATQALAFNSLVTAWPELAQQAAARSRQTTMDV